MYRETRKRLLIFSPYSHGGDRTSVLADQRRVQGDNSVPNPEYLFLGLPLKTKTKQLKTDCGVVIVDRYVLGIKQNKIEQGGKKLVGG